MAGHAKVALLEQKGLKKATGPGLERLAVWFIFITTQPLQAAGVANYFWNKVEGSHQSYYLPVAEGSAEPTEGDSERPTSVRDSRPHPSTLQDISPKWVLVSCVCVSFFCVCVCAAKDRGKVNRETSPTVSVKIICSVFLSQTCHAIRGDMQNTTTPRC